MPEPPKSEVEGPANLSKKSNHKKNNEEVKILTNAEAWLAMSGARVRFFHAQFAQALHLLQSALEWNPTHAALWLQAGLCQRRLGLFTAAQTSFTQARQLNPQCRAAGAALAEVSAQGFFSRLAARWRQAFRR